MSTEPLPSLPPETSGLTAVPPQGGPLGMVGPGIGAGPAGGGSESAARKLSPAPLPEIPGYRLVSILGRGATGTVYRAVQLAVERDVAIKVLHPELANSKAVRRLQREARTTARLAHPGIVSAIDLGQTEGLWWYAMELVDGPALSAVLREKGRLSERDALRLFIPLCEALEHAHEQGVVHRDIKPANILVDHHGRARLVDLGLAFTEDDLLLTKVGGTLGTPHYLSPEQARNPQAVDVRSDIWSLGATMFHALCGRPPFAGESLAEILSGVLYAHIPDPRELEPGLSTGMTLVLRKCLTRNADRRYGSPSELLRDLEALRERRAVRVSTSGLDPLAGEAERRRRRAWAAAIGLSILVLVALVRWQPWGAQSSVGDLPASAREGWAPLDSILAGAAGPDRRGPGLALASLDELAKDQIPENYVPDYWAARAQVQSRFDARIDEERKRITQSLERALTQERDFVQAAQIVALSVEERLARELGANEEQRRAVVRRLDLSVLREQVGADERAALSRYVQSANEHLDGVVLPLARQARAAGRWRDAREIVRRDVRETLEEAGISARGISPEGVQDTLANVRVLKFDSELRSIETAWREQDALLVRTLETRRREIEGALRLRELGEDASTALDAAFAAELAAGSIEPVQMLVDVSDRAHATLSKAREELLLLERELLAIDARTELAAVDEQVAPAWRERRYQDIADLWQARLEDAWLRPTHGDVELRMGEARLLQSLLDRAAAGLRAPGLDSILVGTILRKGRIEVGSSPLSEGFVLMIAGKSESYALRAAPGESTAKLLKAPGIERLAGLAADPKDDALPLDRLARSLFRLREGDLEAATRVFHSGPLPMESHGPLVAELEQRLSLARNELSTQLQRREEAARGAFNLIQRERSHARDAAARVKRINDLLVQYADTEFVKERESELRELRSQILATGKVTAEDRLRGIYGADISFPAAGRVAIERVFSVEELPRWTAGDWKRSPGGWSAERHHSRAELEDEALWPRFLLEEPLDLNGAMSVELSFEQPQSSGQPKRFVASVAGWHIGLAGPSEVGGQSQVLVTAGGVDALHDMLVQLDDEKGIPIQGLSRGQTHVLRIELMQGRGKCTATLDGAELPRRDEKRPDGRGGSSSIVLRSLEPVILKSVRIEAVVGQK
ncbi:MAG: serine/threonine protein kinase [Planctomycetes bacterium]|nr:serine/threonine protein kinase [Planctomycetota bacterium]